MTFEEWLPTVPEPLTRDPIWRRTDYRLATYVCDAAWSDVERLVAHPATRSIADQLYRAIGSVGANIAEGYSRGTGADRIRFYEYALGSAREAREWFWKGRRVIGVETVAERVHLIDQVVRLLLTAIKSERAQRLSAPRLVADRSGRRPRD
jgi:four helix bundle protein